MECIFREFTVPAVGTIDQKRGRRSRKTVGSFYTILNNVMFEQGKYDRVRLDNVYTV